MSALLNSGLLILALLLPASQAPSFEAASIKLTQAAPGSTSGIRETRGRIAGTNVTLKRCIRGAYDIPEALVFGGPKWVDEERYDIEAVAAGPASGHDLMIMLQSLLADRFQLKFHRERREISGYALVLAKGGIKADASAKDTPWTDSASRGRLESRASTMANLAQKLSDALRTPVVDFTALDGKYDFTLSWDPRELTAVAADKAPADPSGPSIFTALEEQLGLKLEFRKVPVEVIVIDSANKPSE